MTFGCIMKILPTLVTAAAVGTKNLKFHIEKLTTNKSSVLIYVCISNIQFSVHLLHNLLSQLPNSFDLVKALIGNAKSLRRSVDSKTRRKHLTCFSNGPPAIRHFARAKTQQNPIWLHFILLWCMEHIKRAPISFSSSSNQFLHIFGPCVFDRA